MNDSTLKSGSSLQGGKYIIQRVLGQGGFGITYEAEQVSLGRRVAVKEFFMKEYCERDGGTSYVTMGTSGSKELVEKFRMKFIREARMIAGLDHEHIVKIIDVFEENGTAYYVMEYLGGGCLGDGVKAGKAMPEGEAVESIRQIASALSYLHNKGIIHFDVKPSNVLRTEDGKLKLIDFGISKHYDEAGQQTSSTPVGISKGYAPLEQYQQGSDIKSFTPATDIYSLGATLYALLSGTNPPEASIVNEDGVPVIEGVSPNIMHAIEKAMQPRRKDRPQSVAEFLRMLDSPIADDEETVVPGSDAGDAKTDNGKGLARKPAEPQKQSEPKPEKKNPADFPKWLYGAFAGIAVAVMAAVLLNRSGKPEISDLQQTVSTTVVVEAVAETPVTNQPSESASKPETLAKPETPTVIELKSISLNKTALELEEGGNASLTVQYSPNNATNKSTTWKSSNTSVVKVNGNGKVTAAKAGTATIIASCGGKDAYCNVTVKAKEVQPTPSSVSSTAASASTPSSSLSSTTGTHNGHEWVDLGLSVKWATCNVGASSPEDYGDYFAWGETSPKSEYTYANLKYHTEGDSEDNVKFSKYVKKSKYGQVDFKRALEYSDDAARANWGGSWRMPNEEECRELMNACTWTWTTMNGKNGYKVVSKSNGNSIFLPAAGMRYDTVFRNVGTEGYYWSCSLDDHGRDGHAFSIHFDLENNYYLTALRRNGLSVRPVFYR